MRLGLRLTTLLVLLALMGLHRGPASTAFAQRGIPPLMDGRELGIHVVADGESLFRLSSRYGMTSEELARLNGIHAHAVLVPGWPLWVPLDRAINALADAPARPADGGQSQSSAGDSSRHQVLPGETLFGISRRYNVPVDALKRWNGLSPDGSIQAGTELIVQAPGGPESDATGDPERPEAERPQDTGGQTRIAHVVAAGETLTSIAARYGESVVSLKRFNGMLGDEIVVGQRILVPGHGLGPDAAPAGAKRIEVDVSEQRMYVWQGDTLVWSLVVSTGLPGYPTRRGSFAVQSKIPNAWSGAWQLWMPNWLGIYWAGPSENGIHALPIINGQRLWGGYLGSPISYGCVVLGSEDAERLYNWAEIGTPVIIRD